MLKPCSLSLVCVKGGGAAVTEELQHKGPPNEKSAAVYKRTIPQSTLRLTAPFTQGSRGFAHLSFMLLRKGTEYRMLSFKIKEFLPSIFPRGVGRKFRQRRIGRFTVLGRKNKSSFNLKKKSRRTSFKSRRFPSGSFIYRAFSSFTAINTPSVQKRKISPRKWRKSK